MSFSDKDVKDTLHVIYDTKDKELLWAFIKDFFGLKIPRKAVCEDHDAPFDFVADIFFNSVRDAVAVANRTGGKTTDFAIVDALNWYHWPNCEIATVGAIEEQAKKCYTYFQDWVTHVDIFKQNLVDSLMRETTGKNGSLVQILTGTISGVNSPHPQKAFLDEVELMQWNIIQEAFSMAKSKGEIKGQTIITSTRKYAFGPMERLLSEADERGFSTYKWCVRETIEPHGEDDVIHRPKKGDILLKNTELYEDLERYYDEDGNFPSDGFLTLDDVYYHNKKLDRETWVSQWLCEKPMATALVYPQFKDRVHIKEQRVVTSKKLVLSEDIGFAEGHADVVGFWQEHLGGDRLIDSIWVEGKTDDEVIDLVEDKIIEMGFVPDRYLKEKDNRRIQNYLNKAVEAWYCPPEAQSSIALRKKRGYKVLYMDDRDKTRLEYGIPIVRSKLEERDANGECPFQIDPSCSQTIQEMKIYSNKIRKDGTILDEPAKKNDNGPDMIRYYFINHTHIQTTQSLAEANKKSREGTKPITAGLRDMEF